MKKIKHRKMPSELTMLYPLKRAYRRAYYKVAQDLRIEKKLKLKIQSYRKIELAVAFLNFYYVKKAYIFFYQKKVLKRKNIKKPKYTKLKTKVKKLSYTKNELLNILFGN